MRVGAIQSSFIPWRGYFDFIASVDTFVFLDDVQYTVRDWRNRNKIKTPRGTEWLTVPVVHGGRRSLINETKIDYSRNWTRKILGAWTANYGRAEFYEVALGMLYTIEATQHETLSSVNTKLTQLVCEYLGIDTPLRSSLAFDLVGEKTDRLIDLLKKLHATTYLSGPSADAYLDKDAFRKNGIRLEYKSYDYAPYPQLWGPFEGAVTVLDLIANCGLDARRLIRSRMPDQVIIR